jgi:hypothetical protein
MAFSFWYTPCFVFEEEGEIFLKQIHFNLKQTKFVQNKVTQKKLSERASFVLVALMCGLLSIQPLAHGAMPLPCPEFDLEEENLKVTQRTLGSMGCIIEVSPKGTAYREERNTSRVFGSFDSSRALTITESYEYATSQDWQNTGVQEILFFPRREKIRLQEVTEHEAVLRVSDRGSVWIDLEHGVIREITGAEISHSPNVSRRNMGGLEIHSSEEMLILNVKGRNGRIPRAYKKGRSEWIGSNGTRCEVENSEIFNYDQSTPSFLFPDERELEKFLQARCPKLDLLPLSPNPALTRAVRGASSAVSECMEGAQSASQLHEEFLTREAQATSVTVQE